MARKGGIHREVHRFLIPIRIHAHPKAVMAFCAIFAQHGWFDFIDFFHVDGCALITGVIRVIFCRNIIDETAPYLSSSSAASRKALG